MNSPNRLLAVALFFLAARPSGFAETISEVGERYRLRTEQAVEALNLERERIQDERSPLARELRDKEAEVAALRRESDRIRQLRQAGRDGLEQLRATVGTLANQQRYLAESLLPEYAGTWETSLTPGSWSAMRGEIEAYCQGAADLEQGLRLVDLSLARLEASLGGTRYGGEAVDADGRILQGRFVELGPLLFFSGVGQAGPALADTASPLPVVQPLSGAQARLIAEVAESGSGQMPIDPSAGTRLGRRLKRDTLREHVGKGGIWVVPILAFAGIATAIAIVKSIRIFRIRRSRPGLIHELVDHVRAGDLEKARQLAALEPAPIGPMLANAAAHANEPPELVEEIMYEAMLDIQPRLESGLNVIAVTAAAAPLLGLLGTVTGIIKTFNLMGVYGAGDPRPLISGISEALITTELGLLLAIPALVVHALLQRRVSAIMADMEKHAVTFLNGLARRSHE